MHLGSALAFCVALAVSNLPGEQANTPKPKPTSPPRAAAAPAALTNNDIIQMVSAGLSEQIIIGAIQQAAAKNFDLAVGGLVALKKAAVPDAVIRFMQTGELPSTSSNSDVVSAAASSVPASAKAAPTDAGAAPLTVSDEDGVYYIDGDLLHRIEAKTPYQTRTGSTAVARLTFGIKKKRLNAMLPGLSADIQVSQAPKFYVHVSENESVGEYYLIRFTVKQEQGRRELEVASAGLGKAQQGFAEKDIYLIDAKRLEKNIYLVTPKVGLSAGEYSLLVVPQATGSGQTGLTPRKIFDFSVR